MSSAAFTAVVRTPIKSFFEGEVDVVRMSTDEGQLEIFPGHAPLAATVNFSRLRVQKDDHEEEFMIRNGLVFMDPASNFCRILVQQCDAVDSIDYRTAKEYLDFILERLDSSAELSKYQLKYLEDEKLAISTAMEELPKEGNEVKVSVTDSIKVSG